MVLVLYYCKKWRRWLHQKEFRRRWLHQKGSATSESDIDIAVIVDEIQGDYLSNTFLLYKLRRNVDDRIEPVLLESGSDPSGFLEEVRRTGQVIYTAA